VLLAIIHIFKIELPITLNYRTLSACGTAQGVMNGVGAVLDGMGNDARSIGSIFN